jgi:hypothetical protein
MSAPLDDATGVFVRDALAWLIAGELAHAVHGDLVCPHPTVTHERGDDVWTASERALAMRLASGRMRYGPERDAWAASVLVALGIDEAPAITFLHVIELLEDARPEGDVWSYVAHHPHARVRADTMERAAPESATETSAVRRRMR